MSDYTIENLSTVEDSAPKGGMDAIQEARFARGALDAAATGIAYHRFKPGMRQPFGHRHHNAEEIYVVMAGSGRVRLDDEVREIAKLDAIRVAPAVVRAFEADGDGMDVIVFGPHHDKDGEIVKDFWPAD